MPETSAALIDQLVYIDNFINSAAEETPNLDMDGQLLLDLAAFADDLFVFPDEEKRKEEDNDDFGNHDVPLLSQDLKNSWFVEQNDSQQFHDVSVVDNSNKGARSLSSINERTKIAKLNRMSQYGQPEKEEGTKADSIPNLALFLREPSCCCSRRDFCRTR